MTKELEQRKDSFEAVLSRIAGVKVGLYIRGLREFTIWTEGNNLPALEKVRAFLDSSVRAVGEWGGHFDEELNETYAWFTIREGAEKGGVR